jgi:hypothetical protein
MYVRHSVLVPGEGKSNQEFYQDFVTENPFCLYLLINPTDNQYEIYVSKGKLSIHELYPERFV